MKKSIKAILFDLDGTLLDTAPDLGRALNNLLVARKLPELPIDKIRPTAGRGCRGLLKIGFDMDHTHQDYPAFSQELLEHYQKHLLDTTNLFPGMKDVLDSINKKQLPWGIVTNKPHCFTEQIIAHLPTLHSAKCIVSGDTLPRAKPHPDPILHACTLLNIEPDDCIYVGDSEVDIIASKAAGTQSIVALYGYIPTGDDPQLWQADRYISKPEELLAFI